MPLYEYRCSKCGNISEIMVGIGGQSDVLQCKYCGCEVLNKIPTCASVATAASRSQGRTCCGSEERCHTPPCSAGNGCRRD